MRKGRQVVERVARGLKGGLALGQRPLIYLAYRVLSAEDSSAKNTAYTMLPELCAAWQLHRFVYISKTAVYSLRDV